MTVDILLHHPCVLRFAFFQRRLRRAYVQIVRTLDTQDDMAVPSVCSDSSPAFLENAQQPVRKRRLSDGIKRLFIFGRLYDRS